VPGLVLEVYADVADAHEALDGTDHDVELERCERFQDAFGEAVLPASDEVVSILLGGHTVRDLSPSIRLMSRASPSWCKETATIAFLPDGERTEAFMKSGILRVPGEMLPGVACGKCMGCLLSRAGGEYESLVGVVHVEAGIDIDTLTGDAMVEAVLGPHSGSRSAVWCDRWQEAVGGLGLDVARQFGARVVAAGGPGWVESPAASITMHFGDDGRYLVEVGGAEGEGGAEEIGAGGVDEDGAPEARCARARGRCDGCEERREGKCVPQPYTVLVAIPDACCLPGACGLCEGCLTHASGAEEPWGGRADEPVN